MESEISKITKLKDVENWAFWKFQVETLMSHNDVITVVTGEFENPGEVPADADAAATTRHTQRVAAWKKLDGAARRMIATSVSEKVMVHIMHCKCSKEMWEKLHEVFENKNETSRHILQQQWFTVGKESADDMLTHIAKIKDLAHRLTALGDKIEDGMVMTKILMTLPPSYQYFVTAWESTSPDQRTLTNLISRLTTEETRVNLQQGNGALTARASNSTFPAKKGRNKSKKRPGKCYNCGEVGHWRSDCKKEKSENKEGNEKERKPKVLIVSTGLTSATDGHLQEDRWYLDSGASQHMSGRKGWFVNYTSLQEKIQIKIGNGDVILAHGKGDIDIEAFDGKRWDHCVLKEVLYVPELKFNLYSVPAAADRGLKVVSEQEKCTIFAGDQQVAVGERHQNLYRMNFKVIVTENDCGGEAFVHSSSKESLQTWHERLAHQNVPHVKKFLKDMGVQVNTQEEFFCDACALGKMHKLPFETSQTKSDRPGDLVHADLCGTMEEESLGGAKYFLLLKDDYSHFRTLFFIRNKSEVMQCLEEFLTHAQTQLGMAVKKLRTDNGLEFINAQVKAITRKRGITHERTVVYTPEQNGSAERENRTLGEAARTMMCSKGLGKDFWAEAVNAAAFVINRTGTSSIPGKTPYELWFGKPASKLKFRIFGTKAFGHIPRQKRKKWDPKSEQGIFVGYGETTKGYRIWFPKTEEVKVLRDVVFANERPGLQQEEKKPEEKEVFVRVTVNDKSETEDEEDEEPPNLPDLREQDEEPEPPDEDPEAPEEDPRAEPAEEREGRYRLRDRRGLQPPRYLRDYINVEELFLAENQEPEDFDDAVRSEQANHWRKAMDCEMNSLQNNKTWKLVELPRGAQVLKNRWVFKIKQKADGTTDKYKARLVVKGFTQKPGIDYFETFSPVVKFTSIRTVLAVAVAERMNLAQFDVETAFLNGNLDEDIYMTQPQGYEDGSGKVCKLNKALYGLKQSARCWNTKFTQCLKRFNLTASNADPCVFINREDGDTLILAVYIDDGLVASTNKDRTEALLMYLSKELKIKTGKLDKFLGMEFKYLPDGSMLVNQQQYAHKIVERFRLGEAHAVAIPADQHQDLSIQTEESKHTHVNVPYKEAVGSLFYLAMVSRPDIAYAVNAVSQYAEAPTKERWNAVKRIIKYVKGTMEYGILFKPDEPPSLKAYSDADFAGDRATRRSTSGSVIFAGEAAVSWAARKQKSVALSTTESEFMAASDTAKEVVWLERLLKDLVSVSVSKPVLLIDNQSAIRLIKNPELHQRSKHIDVRFHFVRELYEKDVFDIEYVNTEFQVADICTKPLAKERYEKLRKSLVISKKEIQ